MPLALKSLSLKEAKKIIDSIVRKAEEDNGPPVAISVVGISGRLIAFEAMDGVIPACIKLSQSKAYSALIGQRDTIAWASFPKNLEYVDFDMRNWTDPNFSGFTGGVLVELDKDIIGGIGVSGRKGKMSTPNEIMQDNELADYGRQQILTGTNEL